MVSKYGLPEEVIFCSRCVVSNQRPSSKVEWQHKTDSNSQGVAFDSQGVCAPCSYAEVKRTQIDWARRRLELQALEKTVRNHAGPYNCLVPGSGGKDSFMQARILKYEFGFRPLTFTWAPNMFTPWGFRNFQAWNEAGFDNYLFSPNRLVQRLLTRLAVENLFHPFQPFIIGQKAFASGLASNLDIPLVFYGENEAEYGNSTDDNNSPDRSDQFSRASGASTETYLGGVSLEALRTQYGLSKSDLAPYLPQASDSLARRPRVLYLGYFVPWHPQDIYYRAAREGGFRASPYRTMGSYSRYNSIDDKIDDLHFWTYFIKFGIGRATYDAAQEIRNGEIDREDGVQLVRRFDGEWPWRFEQDISEYLTIGDEFPQPVRENFETRRVTKDYLFHLADKFRSPHLWEMVGGWRLRAQVS